MSISLSNESFVEVFHFETLQNLEELEFHVLNGESTAVFGREGVQKMFRILHTIKGSAAMMSYLTISNTAHALEDLFSNLQEVQNASVNEEVLTDLILGTVDFIKTECQKVGIGQNPDGDARELLEKIRAFHDALSRADGNQTEAVPTLAEKWYSAYVRFDEGCEMVNIRAFVLVQRLTPLVAEIHSTPADLTSEDSAAVVARSGLRLTVRTAQSYEELQAFFEEIAFVAELDLQIVVDTPPTEDFAANGAPIIELTPSLTPAQPQATPSKATPQGPTMMSVNVEKLDQFMDLIGEMVIAESMVTHHPDLKGLKLADFHRATRQLHKITTELKDIALSIRMVPLTKTFQKMHRVVRDVARKLEKDVAIEVIGDEIEVDKNIIEHISDPLMHLVRNAVDHGLEKAEERKAAGKPLTGTVTLAAQNSGGYVLVTIRDDGRGLNPDQLLRKAREKGLLTKPAEDMSEKDIMNLIFLPGFSTKTDVSEFSGRGVGMDVVAQNIEAIGGSLIVDSQVGVGTSITMKIPTTLAIIDGMNVRVGKSIYTIPTTSVIESFRPAASAVLTDPDGREMIMVRGRPYALIRLNRRFGVQSDHEDVTKGIVLMVMGESSLICLVADELVGMQQVVVKALPTYIQRLRQTTGLAGCTLLGNGSISLIINTVGLTA